MVMPGWIDFRLLKQTVSICEVLEPLSDGSLDPVVPGSLRGCCPLPLRSSTSPEASFLVNVRKNVSGPAHCAIVHPCSGHGATGGNILDLVCLMEAVRCDPRVCSSRAGHSAYQHTKCPTDGSTTMGSFRSQNLTTNPKLAFRLKPIQFHHPYLKRRCVQPLAC